MWGKTIASATRRLETIEGYIPDLPINAEPESKRGRGAVER